LTLTTSATPDGRIDAVLAELDRERMKDIAVALVGCPSPPGLERPLAELASELLRGAGLEAWTQIIDDEQANAVGRLGSGPASLMLYAPIDTLITGTEADIPWAGRELRPDMMAAPLVDGDLIVGLGAGNPKGHAAVVIAVAEAIAAAGVPLDGELIVGLGAGGMPTNAPAGARRRNIAQGAGCSFMLEQGVWADQAVIAKPGWSASWEEVGLCWFEFTVHGTHTYVGSRHLLPYRNPIVDAASLIAAFEEWAPGYTGRHTEGLVAPQVNIGSIRAGWPEMPSVSSAACKLMVDVRVSPRTTPAEVKAEMESFMATFRHTNPDIEVESEMVLAIPGSRTDPEHPIVTTAISSWEAVTGEAHVPATKMSGGTDANILRNRGIPTVRIGMPKATVRSGDLDFQRGMNTASISDMMRLGEVLTRIAITTLSRTENT